MPVSQTGEPSAIIEQGQRWVRRALSFLLFGLLLGLVGVYWDIAWHIEMGRHTFFTPPHNFIYGSMLIVVAVAGLALANDRRDSPAHASVGRFRFQLGMLVAGIGALLVLAFGPLDEFWHAAFGEDLTLWGPMHLVGLAGFVVAALGGLIASVVEEKITPGGWAGARWHVLGFATALLALVVLHLAEYEFAVPAFPMFLHPALLAGGSVLALVLVARLDVFPWAATLTAVAFTGLRVFVHVWLVGMDAVGWAGAYKPVFPFLILTGFVVDVLVHRVRWGALVGVVGAGVTLVANVPVYMLTEVYPWTVEIVVPAVVGGLVLGGVMGWVGVWIADALRWRAGRWVPESGSEGVGSS